MKTSILIALYIFFISPTKQKLITKTGLISFEASVPSFEEVAAKNNSVTAILNTETGEFASLALVKAFRFKNALMEEHFNENYAESSKFPKATFKGKIENFNISKLSTNTTEFILNGELNFHGIKKDMNSLQVKIAQKDSHILIMGTFTVKAEDFNIEIPKIVGNKIAEDILVQYRFELSE